MTGASRSRVPASFEPLLAEVVADLERWPGVSLHLYGSVATGQARPGRSDVDLLAFGLPTVEAARLGADLSARHHDLCRGVEIGTARIADLDDDSDQAYGLRVFLRHYCVHLGGPPTGSRLPAFAADARAVRGFNGDLARHRDRWRERVVVDDPAALGRRVARKTLLAVAGLVSLAGSTWTTDRDRAAREYGAVRPPAAQGMATLAGWADGDVVPGRSQLVAVLEPGGLVDQVVDDFARTAGLWRGPT